MNNELNREINLKSILAFTLPSIFMMVVMSLYTIVDGIFVSRLINTNAFSAVNIIYPLMSIVIGLGTMFGTGTTAIVSRKLGEGRQKEANQIVTFIILFTIGLGIAFSVVSCLFLGDIIHLLGANDAVFDYCREYALPIILFLPFSLLQVQFQSLFVANGKPGTGLLVTLVSGLANVFLDYYFIAVCNMGVAGAAVATGIGYFIAAVFGLYYFARHREAPLHFVKPRASMQTLMRAMTNGSSEMVSNLSTSVTTFLFNIIMMRLIGPDGVAAISILLYLDFVLIAINLGYSIGVAPVFSYNYGSGDCRKLKKLFRISLYFCTSVGVVMTAGTVLFADWLASVFSPAGSAVHALAATGLRIFAVSYLFKGFSIFTSALFTAFGNGTLSANLSFMRTLILLVSAILLFSSLFGITGVWSATPAAETIAFLLAAFLAWKYGKVYRYL